VCGILIGLNKVTRTYKILFG